VYPTKKKEATDGSSPQQQLLALLYNLYELVRLLAGQVVALLVCACRVWVSLLVLLLGVSRLKIFFEMFLK
jgi:hypothetical protein